MLTAINAQRLVRNWETLSGFHDPDQPGWTRRPFTSWYSDARGWLREQMHAARLATELDAAGNLIGRRPGRVDGLRPIVIGSHTDTVSGGGRFDGIVGVLAAVEVAHSLDEAGTPLAHPLEVIDYLAEEPTDYGLSTVGSRALCGSLLPEHLARTNHDGLSLGQAIQSLGGAVDRIPQVARARGSIAAALELHIEQGTRLEAARVPLGIVTAITGITRYLVQVQGRPDHAGGTPMGMRKDALAGAADVILAVENLFKPGEGVATVGRLEVTPNATNVVPGHVTLWTEMRSVEAQRLADLCAKFPEVVQQFATRRDLGIDADLLSHEEPVTLTAELRDVIATALDRLRLRYLHLPSFAGHDTNQLAKIAPVAMLFVPSRGGRSHCPEEWTAPDEMADGARALLASVRAVDAALGSACH